MPAPLVFRGHLTNAAVVCAADRCDHRDHHGGPLLFALPEISLERGGLSYSCIQLLDYFYTHVPVFDSQMTLTALHDYYFEASAILENLV